MNTELKEALQLAIISTLDTYEQDMQTQSDSESPHEDIEDLDIRLLDAVMEVLEAVKQAPPGFAVKYIGKREVYEDALYGTKEWKRGQTKIVSEDTLKKMLKHPDVYVEGSTADAVESIADVKQDDEQDDEMRLTEAKNSVNAMTRKEHVRKFVADNYNGLEVPAEFQKLDEMKAFAVNQIDRYGMI